MNIKYPKISLIVAIFSASIWIFSLFARSLVDILRNSVGTPGISAILWLLATTVAIYLINKARKLGLKQILLLTIFLSLTALYLSTFRIIEERLHVIKFGTLAILICNDNHKLKIPYSLLSGFLLSSLVGAIDEIWQSFIPGRVGDLRDIGFNMIGALWGTLCWLMIKPLSKNREQIFSKE